MINSTRSERPLKQCSPLRLKFTLQPLRIMIFLRSVSSFCTFCLAAILVAPTYAQNSLYTITPESSLHVDGTSNQTPEWRVYATEIIGMLSLSKEGVVDSLELVVPSKMMKSRKSPIMDRGMYGALQADDYPEILYKLRSTSISAVTDSTFTLNSTGDLTIAATTREIIIPVEGVRKQDGTVHFTGTHTLLMTDYGLKPPSLMFGAYRTGNELIVTFEIRAVPAEQTF